MNNYVANVKTGEVFKTDNENAMALLKKENHFITDKKVYKMFKKGENPTFTFQKVDKKGKVETLLKNVLIPSIKKHKSITLKEYRKQENLKRKQWIKPNFVYVLNEDKIGGEWFLVKGRTVWHKI
jgi:hypothetical protein